MRLSISHLSSTLWFVWLVVVLYMRGLYTTEWLNQTLSDTLAQAHAHAGTVPAGKKLKGGFRVFTVLEAVDRKWLTGSAPPTPR